MSTEKAKPITIEDTNVITEETEAEKKARQKAIAEADAVNEMTPEEYMLELVPFQAIYDGERYKDDITQTINGKTWQIQRGIMVMVPRNVHKALMDAEKQKRMATQTSQDLVNRYNDLVNKQIF